MKQFLNDVFKTKQQDGTFKYDLTNVAYSFIPWSFSILTYIIAGIVVLIKHPELFDFLKYAGGFATLFSGGLAGVFIHSKSST